MTVAMFQDTIFALSSGRLPSGVAVVRVSGPHVRTVLAAMAGGVPPTRQAVLRTIKAAAGEAIDRGLVLFFDGPASFSGEDSCEFHLHGGVASVAAVLSSLGDMPGLRLADAGEFTRRAFLNGKLDLTQAEGLADLIAAETEAQRRLALRNAEGGQRRVYEEWRKRILHGRAMIEAELDFADEADVPGSVADRIWADMQALERDIDTNLGSARAGEIVRNGFEVIILGAPNAGKSSLMNALARRDVSIITEEAGTTRDLVEVRLDLGGIRVNLIDTAGIRENPGRIEEIGIKKALIRSSDSDLVLLVEDASAPGTAPQVVIDGPLMRVGLKSDLRSASIGYDLSVSARTGAGLDELRDAIGRLARMSASSVADATPVRERQARELTRCRDHLRDALALTSAGLEVRAEELRLAGDALARLVGRIDVEELLDVVFSQFCVGK